MSSRGFDIDESFFRPKVNDFSDGLKKKLNIEKRKPYNDDSPRMGLFLDGFALRYELKQAAYI